MSNEWSSSTWNQTLTGFCESSLFSHEFVNTSTSLFIIFWGIYGLYQLPSAIHQTSDTWRQIYSLLTAVGIGSTVFHWTLYVGWGLLDSLPMLLAEYVALFQVLEIFFRVKLRSTPTHKTMFSAITKCLSVVLVFLALLSVINTALYGQHHFLFILIFSAVPFLILFVVIWAALDPGLFRNQIKESPQYKCIFRHLWIGFGLTAVAGIVWNVTEPLCDSVWWIKYIPTHGIWHFFIGYGMYNLIQAGIFIDFDINYKDKTCSYEMAVHTKENGRNKLQRLWYHVVPVLYRIKEDDTQSDVSDMQERIHDKV